MKERIVVSKEAREERAKNEAKLLAEIAERRREIERLIREDESRRSTRRLAASY